MGAGDIREISVSSSLNFAVNLKEKKKTALKNQNLKKKSYHYFRPHALVFCFT